MASLNVYDDNIDRPWVILTLAAAEARVHHLLPTILGQNPASLVLECWHLLGHLVAAAASLNVDDDNFNHVGSV